MQPSIQNFDLIIVGGGMVGATLAVQLGMSSNARNLNIAVIEAGVAPPSFDGDKFDPRVVALSKTSQQLLCDLGVWSGVAQKRACPYMAMDVWDAEGTGNIQFHAHDIHADNLGYIVENSNLVNVLRARLADLPKVQLFDHCKVEAATAPQSDERVALTVRQEGTQLVLCAPLVVAADGARSKIRDWAGLETREWDYGHSAIVTTVVTEQSHQHTCWQRFTSTGPIAFLPLQLAAQYDPRDSQHCSLVWSAENTLAEHLTTLDDSGFCEALSRAFESRLGAVLHADKRFCIPLRQRHAKRYFKPGFVLLGDAAHTIHPLAGQGVNLGFYDVMALAAEIERACAREIPLSDASIMRRYQRQRQGHNLSAMLSMEGFKRLFEAQPPAIRWLRNTGMSFVNHQLFLKKQLSKIAAGQQ